MCFSQLTVLCPEGGSLTRTGLFNCYRVLGTLARARQSRGVPWVAAKNTRAPYVCKSSPDVYKISPPGSTSAWEGARERRQCLLGGAQQTACKNGACWERERERKKDGTHQLAPGRGEEEAGTHQSPPMRAGLQKCVKSDASPSSQCSKTSKGLGSPRPAISALGQMSPSQTPLRGFLDHYFCEGLLGGRYCLLVKARCFGALLSCVSMKNWGCSVWDLNPSLLREKLQVVSSH